MIIIAVFTAKKRHKISEDIARKTIRDFDKILWNDIDEKSKDFTLNTKKGIIHVKNRKHFIKSSFKIEHCISYDTETYQGKCRLLSRGDTRGKTASIFKPTFLQCLEFLLYNASHKGFYRTFFNMDFDVSAILKLLYEELEDKEIADKLIEELYKGKEIEIAGFKLSYISRRLFIIKKGKISVKFTDIWAFYHSKLEDACQDNLNTGKLKEVDAARLNEDWDYWLEVLDETIEYCERDALLTAKLTELRKDSLQKVDIELPKFLCSYASVSKQNFRKKCNIPSITCNPSKILEIAMNTYYGGRFEINRKGSFDNLHLYDIVSEYPTKIKELPSFKYGIWKKVEEIAEKETYGFYYVKLNIPKLCRIPTIPVKKRSGILTFPYGQFIDWYTWHDLDLMREYIEEIYEAYEYIESEGEYRPFKKEIEHMIKVKTKIKNKIKRLKNIPKKVRELTSMYDSVKGGMNALYGCFVECNKDYDGNIHAGTLFNPINATFITSYGRWKIIKDIPEEKREYIVAFHTDSITTIVDISDSLDLGTDLGKWEYEKYGKGCILGTGLYQIGKSVKTRGFKKKSINSDYIEFFTMLSKISKSKDVGYIKKFSDFFKNLGFTKDEIKEIINHFQEYENITDLPVKSKRMFKIREAMIRRGYSIEDVNKMFEEIKYVSLNGDTKRNWNDNFENCEDFLSRNIGSKPMRCKHYVSYQNEEITEITIFEDDSVLLSNKLNDLLEGIDEFG